MKLSIVFPIHNGINFTKSSLEFLQNQLKYAASPAEIQIIIIDDGSTDGSSEWIKKRFEHIHILEGDGNLWWGGGMNKGLKYAFEEKNSDFVLCWNNDIVANENYFVNLFHEITLLNKDEFICSKIMYKDSEDNKLNNIIFACGCTFNKKTGKSIIIGNKKIDSIIYQQSTYVDWCGGMGMVIPKSLFKKIGYFDNLNFPQYKSDADYCLRAKQNGFKLKFCPELIIFNERNNSGINNKFDNLHILLPLLYSNRSIYNIKLNYNFFNKHCNIIGFLLGMTRTYMSYIKIVYKVLLTIR
jgi:GT2 family glycosyltransferase